MPFSPEKLAQFYRDNTLKTLRDNHIAMSEHPRYTAAMEFDIQFAPMTTMRDTLIAAGLNADELRNNASIVIAMLDCGTEVHGCANFPSIILAKYLRDLMDEPVRMIDAKSINMTEHIAPPLLSAYADRIVRGMSEFHQSRAAESESPLFYLLDIQTNHEREIMESNTAQVVPVQAVVIVTDEQSDKIIDRAIEAFEKSAKSIVASMSAGHRNDASHCDSAVAYLVALSDPDQYDRRGNNGFIGGTPNNPADEILAEDCECSRLFWHEEPYDGVPADTQN